MTRKAIENPTVDDVREGDLVTIARGEKGQPGYEERTCLVRDGYHGREACYLNTIRGCVRVGYRITEVRREVPDLPDHAGALAFTDEGLAVSDGDDDSRNPWTVFSDNSSVSYLETADLDNPIAATPVPAKELADLVAALDAESYDSAADTLYDFLKACRREWERAGVPEPEVER